MSAIHPTDGIGTDAERPIDAALFRDGMSRLGAGVCIVTSDGARGRHGFTATAVCSVSDAPPSLLVCVNHQASAYAALVEHGVLAVNVLAADQLEVARAFSGRTPHHERFAAGCWQPGPHGMPLLEGAAAAFECRLRQAVPMGSHDVLMCEVTSLRRGPHATGLAYFERAYQPLGTGG